MFGIWLLYNWLLLGAEPLTEGVGHRGWQADEPEEGGTGTVT